METLAAEYANPVHRYKQRNSSCRSGSSESCICLCYAHVPSDNNYTRQKTRTKKSRFLNKMPTGTDCIRRDNGTAGNAAFLLRSHVCQIGKSPKKHASWSVSAFASRVRLWLGLFRYLKLVFLTAPLFCLQPIAGILPLIQPDTRDALPASVLQCCRCTKNSFRLLWLHI